MHVQRVLTRVLVPAFLTREISRKQAIVISRCIYPVPDKSLRFLKIGRTAGQCYRRKRARRHSKCKAWSMAVRAVGNDADGFGYLRKRRANPWEHQHEATSPSAVVQRKLPVGDDGLRG